MNFFEFKDAPPIRKPFISFIFASSFTFFGLTEPPYNILIFIDFFNLTKIYLILFKFLLNSKFLGIIPVPIDQIGSYAIIIDELLILCFYAPHEFVLFLHFSQL